MNKEEQMKVACEGLEKIIHLKPDNHDVEVRYYRINDNIINNLGPDIVERFRLVLDDEFIFFIKNSHLLYVQNVSADSALMAMAEASFLAASKF